MQRKRGRSTARGAAIGAKINSRYPYSEYGRAYLKRGTAENVGRFGDSYRSASPDQRAHRKEYGYYGRGMYTGHGSFWNKIGQGFRRIAPTLEREWRTYGAPVVRAGLQKAKNMALSKIKNYGGSGMYTGHGAYGALQNTNNLIENQASADSFISRGGIMSVRGATDETGAVHVSNREFITDIYGPTNVFNVQSYSINPGLQQSFPFLSQLASNFEEYEFSQLIFHFRSLVTDVSSATGGQVGTIILATNYNAAALPFSDKQSMVEYAHSHSCRTTEHMSHGVECDPTKNTTIAAALYTRSNPVVTSQDLKTYDKGLFQIAVANLPIAYQNYVIGELWVEYTVMLRKPKLFVSRGFDIDKDVFMFDTTQFNPYGVSAPSGVSISSPTRYFQQNNIGCQVICSMISSTQSTVQVIFPAALSGVYSLKFDAHVLLGSGNWQLSALPLFTEPCISGVTGSLSNSFCGNCYPCYDITTSSSAKAVANSTTNIFGNQLSPTFFTTSPFDYVSAGTSTIVTNASSNLVVPSGGSILWTASQEVHVIVRQATAGLNAAGTASIPVNSSFTFFLYAGTNNGGTSQLTVQQIQPSGLTNNQNYTYSGLSTATTYTTALTGTNSLANPNLAISNNPVVVGLAGNVIPFA